MHGYGVYTWNNGRKYEGMYTTDKKDGHGIYTWADGRQYDGQWKNGVQHGYGQYQHKPNNEKKIGRWEEGHRKNWVTNQNELNQAENSL